jgi:hypothetical protein
LFSLILHPGTVHARARITALQEELHALFNERIRLGFELFPRLRDRYGELFGDLERLVQERTLELSERRRMVELFSLKLDRGQKLDAKTIELVMKAVRNEFARVRSRMQTAFSAERRKEIDDVWRPSPYVEFAREEGNGSARRRAVELRDLYRTLAKRLHPDARPGEKGRRREYWDLVQRGYHRGDLPLLRTLVHLVEALGEGSTGSASDLEIETRRLTAAVRAERAQVDALKRDELFMMSESMKDERWVAHRRHALEIDIANLERDIAKCDRFLAPILSGQKVPPPEIVKTIWSSFVEDMYLNNR